MDLITIDESLKERFILKKYNSDFATGDEENSFKLTVHIKEFSRFNNIKYLSVDGTEFGGIINNLSVDSEAATISFDGRCWRGMLEDKVIIPASGKDYYTASGLPHNIMRQVISDVGLSGLFMVSQFDAPTIKTYQFNRYCTVLEGFIALLKSINYVLIIKYDNGKVYISAEPLRTIYAVDNYDCMVSISQSLRPYNHLICLGQGELKNRQVLHLYLDENGNIGKTQYYRGLNERISVYDYSSVEDEKTLEEYGIKRFEELLESENTSIKLSNAELNIGHYIQAYEHNTNISVKKKISKKILTLTNGKGVINYEVDG